MPRKKPSVQVESRMKKWLEGIGLGHYGELFAQHRIDLAHLQHGRLGCAGYLDARRSQAQSPALAFDELDTGLLLSRSQRFADGRVAECQLQSDLTECPSRQQTGQNLELGCGKHR